MKKLLLISFISLSACSLNITGPTIDNQNTNTNTNNIDIHDIGSFTPSANPTTPVPSPTGGTEVPLNIPSNAQSIATQYASSHPIKCDDWSFIDGLVQTLRNNDTRWGYLVKSSGGVSHDVIAYRATSDNIGAWGVDVIIDYCGSSHFGWNVIGFDPLALWTGSRN